MANLLRIGTLWAGQLRIDFWPDGTIYYLNWEMALQGTGKNEYIYQARGFEERATKREVI